MTGNARTAASPRLHLADSGAESGRASGRATRAEAEARRLLLRPAWHGVVADGAGASASNTVLPMPSDERLRHSGTSHDSDRCFAQCFALLKHCAMFCTGICNAVMPDGML